MVQENAAPDPVVMEAADAEPSASGPSQPARPAEGDEEQAGQRDRSYENCSLKYQSGDGNQ